MVKRSNSTKSSTTRSKRNQMKEEKADNDSGIIVISDDEEDQINADTKISKLDLSDPDFVLDQKKAWKAYEVCNRKLIISYITMKCL